MGYQFSARSGSSIYVEEVGSGPPVLALHGVGGGTYFFHGLAKRLASRHRVFSLDLPGTGGSLSAVQPFSMKSWVADIGDLVAQKIGEPAVILGHSLGTIVALKAWEAWPEHIRALIFTCGLPKVRPFIHERLSKRIEAIVAQGSLSGWGEKVSPGVFSEASMAQKPEITGLFERLFNTQDAAAYVHSLEVLLAADATSVLPTVRVPCTAIIGNEDHYAPPEDVKAFMKLLPAGYDEEIMPGCGHMPFYEAPESFAHLVETFLDGLAANISLNT
jgi:3-oxoadipate enol-lactonase